jgi:RNA polymerase sigma-32 factor
MKFGVFICCFIGNQMLRSSDSDYNSQYIQKIKAMPMLSLEEEVELARCWRDSQSPKSVEKLINAHLRLVAKIASGYRGYGLPLSDLIAEGNIGMMQAMKHYDPEKGFRLSTYAMWWIKASIQTHILHSWSMVKIGTTATQRKLFFNLSRTRNTIRAAHAEAHQHDILTSDLINAIAIKLKVPPSEVEHMSQRMNQDSSLNASVGSEEGSQEWIEWLADDRENQEVMLIQQDEMKKRKDLLDKAYGCLTEREYQILSARRLTEPHMTLEEVAEKFQISRERVRQIENAAFIKLQRTIRHLMKAHPSHV